MSTLIRRFRRTRVWSQACWRTASRTALRRAAASWCSMTRNPRDLGARQGLDQRRPQGRHQDHRVLPQSEQLRESGTLPKGGIARFYGTAKVHKSGAVYARGLAKAIQPEKDRDPGKKAIPRRRSALQSRPRTSRAHLARPTTSIAFHRRRQNPSDVQVSQQARMATDLAGPGPAKSG